jgi:hypothetical protein
MQPRSCDRFKGSLYIKHGNSMLLGELDNYTTFITIKEMIYLKRLRKPEHHFVAFYQLTSFQLLFLHIIYDLGSRYGLHLGCP